MKEIAIREQPLYNYVNVVEKIQSGKIVKLIRRHQFEPGRYRLKKVFSDKREKLLDEYIDVISSRKVMWIKLTNDEAKAILGTDLPPVYPTYVRDLREYLGKHDLAFINTPYLYVHDIQYVKKPKQTKLEESMKEEAVLDEVQLW